MVRKNSLILLLSLTCFTIVFGRQNIIKVSTQAQFENCINRINKGEELCLDLSSGEYIINKGITAKSPLKILGHDSYITAANDTYSVKNAIRETKHHYICKIKSPINVFSLFLNETDKIIPVSEFVNKKTLVNYCQSIEGPYSSEGGTEIKIPLSGELDSIRNKHFFKAYGYFDCGWTEVNFTVDKSDSNHIFCKTIASCNTGNYNYEKRTYKNEIRFVLFNVEPQEGHVYFDNKHIYIPKGIKELTVLNNDLSGRKRSMAINSDLTIEGVVFKNFYGIGIYSNAGSVCLIRDCRFKNTLSYALKIYRYGRQENKPSEITRCQFENCSLFADNIIDIDGAKTGKPKVVISNCSFKRYDDAPLMYKNCTGALKVSTDANIMGCSIFNTPRCHLYINGGKVVISSNALYNTKIFNSYKERNLSSDLGLIYVNHFTKDKQTAINNTSNSVRIENNMLYGAYAYGRDARGVFIDNGRGDVICINNLIFDCQLYSIDSRDVKSLVKTSSIRNRVENNMLANRYRLASGVGLSQEHRPISSGNIMLTGERNVLSGVNCLDPDIVVMQNFYTEQKGDMIRLPSAVRRQIEKYRPYKKIRDRFILK